MDTKRTHTYSRTANYPWSEPKSQHGWKVCLPGGVVCRRDRSTVIQVRDCNGLRNRTQDTETEQDLETYLIKVWKIEEPRPGIVSQACNPNIY